LITTGSLVSGNTFGSVLYSDLKHVSLMLLEFPDYTSCEKCNSIFQLSKLKSIGSFEWNDESNPEWQEAQRAGFLTIDQYFSALKLGFGRKLTEELYLRKMIWWKYNDRMRSGKQIFDNSEDEVQWTENCRVLIQLLDDNNANHQIMKSELHRNLADFEQCVGMIDTLMKKELQWMKEKLMDECEKRNRWCVQLKPDL